MGFSVSFMTVLGIKEMQIILLGGALKHAADYYMFALCGVTSQYRTHPSDSFSAYFFGQIAGMVIAGLTNDLFFSEC